MMAKSKRSEYTNLLTKRSIEYLNMLGCDVDRTNNISVAGRAFVGRRGRSDIDGCTPYGVALYIEIKTGTDKLSDDQIRFIRTKLKKGCLCFVVRTWSDLELAVKGIKNYGRERTATAIIETEEMVRASKIFCHEILCKEEEYLDFQKLQAKIKREKKNQSRSISKPT